MIILGAGGLALQLYDVLVTQDLHHNLILFEDEPSENTNDIFKNYSIVSDWREYVRIKLFILGIAKPSVRKRHFEMVCSANGEFATLRSEKAIISSHATFGEAVSVLPFSLIEAGASIGNGVLINAGSYIHHEVSVGDFSVLSPGSRVLGKAKIGNECFIGASAVILPNVQIGNNVIIAAGSIVTKDIPDYSRVKGMPAQVF